MTLRELWFRLTYPLRQRRIARDLREEMSLHVELRAQELLSRGDVPDATDASLAARRQFGNATRIEGAARDAWGWHWLDGFRQDLRYVLRQLAHAPLFAVITMATIAVGIAVNAAAFTFYDAIVLKPLSVRDPGSVVRVVQDARITAPDVLPFSAYDALRKQARTLASVVVTTAPQAFATILPGRSPDEPSIAAARFVSADFAPALGVGAAIGRWFGPDEDAAAVIDYGFWTRSLNADPTVIGRRMIVGGRSLTIVGVAPEQFAECTSRKPSYPRNVPHSHPP